MCSDLSMMTIERNLKTSFNTGTRNQYKWHIKEYLLYLEAQSESPDEVEPITSVKEYTDVKIEERDWGKSMVNTAFYALKWYFEKIQNKLLDKRFFINHGKDSDHMERILTREEVQTIFDAAKHLDFFQNIMIKVGWIAALRRQELVSLKGKNFLDDNVLDVRILKTRRARKRIALPPDLFDDIKSLISKPHVPIFRRPVKEGYTRRYTAGEWSYFFRQWNKKVLQDEGIRWHDFARYTRLVHFVEDNPNFMDVLQLSGHQNPAICRRYFQLAKVEVPELKMLKDQEWTW